MFKYPYHAWETKLVFSVCLGLRWVGTVGPRFILGVFSSIEVWSSFIVPVWSVRYFRTMIVTFPESLLRLTRGVMSAHCSCYTVRSFRNTCVRNINDSCHPINCCNLRVRKKTVIIGEALCSEIRRHYPSMVHIATYIRWSLQLQSRQ